MSLTKIKVHACSVLFTTRTLKKNLYQNTFSKSECILLYLRKSHTNKVLFPTSHNAPCLPRPKFCIIFNFSQDYCSTLEKKLRRNLSGNWVISIFSGLKLKITQLPGGFRLKNKDYAKRWGANKVYLLWETCKWQKLVLCASSQVSKTLKRMQGRNRPLGLVLGELITVSGVRGEGEGGYIISQQKVEEASLFWDRWRNFFT